MGLFRGFLAPLRGAAFISRHHLWPHVALPVVLNLVLAVGVGWLGHGLVRDRLPASWGASAPALAALASWVFTALVALVLFLVLQPIVSAPLVDHLTEKVEILVRGGHPRVGLLRSAWHALLHGLLKTLLYAVALAVTLLLAGTTGPGAVAGVALAGLFLAFDGFDYPLSRREVGFLGKWRYLAVHPGQTLGYGAGVTLLYVVPFALVVAPAVAGVGATLAFLDASSTAHAPPGDDPTPGKAP